MRNWDDPEALKPGPGGEEGQGAPKGHAAARFRTVFFDCDSTLSAVEGIEVLALARGADVAALTEAAMRGEIPLEDVYARRLDLARPSRAEVEALGQRYIDELVPDARAVVAALQAEGVAVHVISGGLLPAVEILTSALGVPRDRVHAVDVRFADSGEYAGFDTDSPLARSGGKPAVIRRLAPEPPVMLVGDGATDLEAAAVVDRFVAYGGVIARPEILSASNHVIRGRSLAPVLAIALPAPPADPIHRALWEKGAALLEG